jgi:hypothetical protein
VGYISAQSFAGCLRQSLSAYLAIELPTETAAERPIVSMVSSNGSDIAASARTFTRLGTHVGLGNDSGYTVEASGYATINIAVPCLCGWIQPG